MYPTALISEQAEFIGIWLAVKVAGQWVRPACGCVKRPNSMTNSHREATMKTLAIHGFGFPLLAALVLGHGARAIRSRDVVQVERGGRAMKTLASVLLVVVLSAAPAAAIPFDIRPGGDMAGIIPWDGITPLSIIVFVGLGVFAEGGETTLTEDGWLEPLPYPVLVRASLEIASSGRPWPEGVPQPTPTFAWPGGIITTRSDTVEEFLVTGPRLSALPACSFLCSSPVFVRLRQPRGIVVAGDEDDFRVFTPTHYRGFVELIPLVDGQVPAPASLSLLLLGVATTLVMRKVIKAH